MRVANLISFSWTSFRFDLYSFSSAVSSFFSFAVRSLSFALFLSELVRNERFGYVELATHPKLNPREFIRCSSYDGQLQVTFSTLRRFDLTTGRQLGE